jgi:hypothetical protein
MSLKQKLQHFFHARAKCSCWFDGWFTQDWGECCARHDHQYMNQSEHTFSKSEVDKQLFKCVRQKGGVIMATVMYLGNKTFSWYYWNKFKE